MGELKRQLKFHYVYTRSGLAWLLIGVFGTFGVFTYLNFANSTTCYGTCTWIDENTHPIVTDMASIPWLILFMFVFFNVLTTFNDRFRISVSMGTSRKNFYFGLLGYYLGLSIGLTLVQFVILLLNQILLPLINTEPFDYSILFPTTEGHYYMQLIYGLGMFIFISAGANVFGVIVSVFGKKAYLILPIGYVLLVSFVNNNIFTNFVNVMLNDPSLPIQMAKFLGVSIALFGLEWFVVSRLEVNR